VMVLSEGYLAFGAEPWQVPNFEDMEPIVVEHRTDPEGFQPYKRDEETLGRPWVLPGTPGMEHRIGGLEKQHVTGEVSYDPDNHEFMCRLRQEKVGRVADFVPELKVDGPESGKLLVLSWGGVFGAVLSAVNRCREKGRDVAHLHLRYLNPFPKDLGDLLSRYETVLIPELNFGHLAHLIRAKYLIAPVSHSKVKGRPFSISEVEEKIEELLS
jgi:2-oxoglutarate ferredoxin oxidoreductase subunit alpha